VGLRTASAPVYNNYQKTVAAINVSGSVSTISLKRIKKEIVTAVMKTDAQISLALGYTSGKDERRSGE
jgi:DNA-binding IclR family transcriptional regulator